MLLDNAESEGCPAILKIILFAKDKNSELANEISQYDKRYAYIIYIQ